MDEKREKGYLAGIGTGIFGIFMTLIGNSVGFSNLTGQGFGAIGLIFIALSIGSFAKPETIGQLAVTVLQNLQNATSGEGNFQNITQYIPAKDVNGNVVNTVGSNNTYIIGSNDNALKSKNSINLDLFMISMYNFGDSGNKGVNEQSLNLIPDLSRMNLFESIQEAMQRDLISDVSTNSGNQWMLTRKGIMYTEALLDKN